MASPSTARLDVQAHLVFGCALLLLVPGLDVHVHAQEDASATANSIASLLDGDPTATSSSQAVTQPTVPSSNGALAQSKATSSSTALAQPTSSTPVVQSAPTGSVQETLPASPALPEVQYPPTIFQPPPPVAQDRSDFIFMPPAAPAFSEPTILIPRFPPSPALPSFLAGLFGFEPPAKPIRLHPPLTPPLNTGTLPGILSPPVPELASPTTSPSAIAPDALQRAYLAAANAVRAGVGAPPLGSNPSLQPGCQAWADHLAQIETLQESGGGDSYGENLAQYGNPDDVAQVVQYWASERPHYDSSDPESAGHWSALVWRSTTESWVSYATSAEDLTFWVARYTPVGNVIGQFKENVPGP